MPDLNKIYLYRMTHIENIPHILEHGITHSNSVNANPNFVPIGDGSLITTRNNFVLNNGRRLGEYIPFYFATRTPMLYKIQKEYKLKPESIVYCVSSVEKMIGLDFLFTDGHAIEGFSSQFSAYDIEKSKELLDWTAINSKYWKDDKDLDLKRRKQSEFLVLGDINAERILGYITYNEKAKSKMIDFGEDEAKIVIRSKYYF